MNTQWLAAVLPGVNACFNGASTLLLLLGYLAIRRKQVRLHQTCMLAALASSALFLLGYLTRMALTGTHHFAGPPLLRALYLAVLLSHMILAVAVLPMLARVLYFAFTAQFARHRRIAKVAYPIWLYVSVTGVLVYWLLYWLAPSLAAPPS